ncbi:MAG: hypothetical protein R6V55_13450 [Desulfovermiculus sp.]
MQGKDHDLNQAIMDLMVAEAQLLAVEGDVQSLFLSRMPDSNLKDNSIATMVWLEDLDRNGKMDMWPQDFFAGESFCLDCSTPSSNGELASKAGWEHFESKTSGRKTQGKARNLDGNNSQWVCFLKEDFSTGLSDWQVHRAGGMISPLVSGIVPLLEISRFSRRDFTYIRKDFSLEKDGNLRFEAMIAAKDVVPGGKNYHRGKFQAALLEDGKMVSWFHDDFQGTTAWKNRSFHVFDLKAGQQIALRIGLQNAKGQVFVKEVRGYFQAQGKRR